MADYSGYTPQRQQQRQDPWADAAVGIAKLFMPDPEMQAKARQSQQSEDYNAARLKDVEAGTTWTNTRNEYDRKRIEQLALHQKLHDERSKILAAAAAQGRELTPAEVARLAAINGEIRGTVSPGEVSKFFAIPGAEQRAKAKADAEKAENDKKEALRIKGEQEKVALRRSDEFKALHAEHSKPIDQTRLENNLMTMFESTAYARKNGLYLTREAARAIASRGWELGYTEAEMLDAAKRLLLKMEGVPAGGELSVGAADQDKMRILGQRKYSDAQIAAYKKAFTGGDELWATEEKNYRGAMTLRPEDIDAINRLGARDPKVLRVRGTPEFIRNFAARNPGKKILFLDTTTGLYGGGIASSKKTIEEGYEPELESTDENVADADQNYRGNRVLLDWEDQ